MTADEALAAVLAALEAADIPCRIVGSLASNFHGIPRSTRDADLVAELEPGRLDRLAAALPSSLARNLQAPFETVTGTPRYLIELAGNRFVCELFVRNDDEHDRERVARKERVATMRRQAFVTSAEDMVVTKLRWASEAHRAKDCDDLPNILAVGAADLDWAYLERWALGHGTMTLFNEIRAALPKGCELCPTRLSACRGSGTGDPAA